MKPKIMNVYLLMKMVKETYRTGDYGFSKDGVFYVLGRKDEQIKFNGYRIELSEIEEKSA